jgi:hypothetical protein
MTYCKSSPRESRRESVHTHPEYSLVTAQHSWKITSIAPVPKKTGLLPTISDKGTRSMGAKPIPQQKVVIPRRAATRLTPHSEEICSVPGLKQLVAKEAKRVVKHESHVMKLF